MLSARDVCDKYVLAASQRSDINEHVPILKAFAARCGGVIGAPGVIREMGVRSGVSTWAFLQGVLEADGPVVLHGYDLSPMPEAYSSSAAGVLGTAYAVETVFHQGNVLTEAAIPCDLLFIDTFHVYGQLRRELALHAGPVRKWIILHDTTVDAEHGEALRAGWDPAACSASTGIPVEEITKGLWPAVTEFLEANGETWELLIRLTNNNGLTILRRKAL